MGELIFFHFNELTRQNNSAPRLGEEVEFNLNVKDGKRSGVHVTALLKGTVDTSKITYRGVLISKNKGPHRKGSKMNFTTVNERLCVAYHAQSKDNVSKVINSGLESNRAINDLHQGDSVKFNVASDGTPISIRL